MNKKFIKPELSPCSLDTYIIRSALIDAVKQVSPVFTGIVIDIGCGQMPYRETVLSWGKVERYIGLDLEKNDIYSNKPDLTWDGKTIPLADNSVDGAMATELFEHCPDPEVVMKEIRRILHPGGMLFFTVPFLWPLHDVPYDQYRYTPFSLARHLANAGFQEVRLQALGGWDESLAQMIGLYARRRPMPGFARFIVSLLAFPIVHILSRQAGKGLQSLAEKQLVFRESDMITGLWGVAYKPESESNKV